MNYIKQYNPFGSFGFIDPSLLIDPMYVGIMAAVVTIVVKYFDSWMFNGERFCWKKYAKSAIYTGTIVALVVYLGKDIRSPSSQRGGGFEPLKFNQTFLTNIGENIYTDF